MFAKMDIALLIIQSVYFILPAYIANIAPVFAKKINFLNIPVDFGKKISKKPIFGSHKTWRGIVSATIFGGIVFYLQQLLYGQQFFRYISLIDYPKYTVALGFIMGFGAIFGDLVKSFFKRRKGIGAGKRWVPFDQVDFVIGALVFSSIFYVPSLIVWVILILISIPVHIIARHIGFLLKICQKW